MDGQVKNVCQQSYKNHWESLRIGLSSMNSVCHQSVRISFSPQRFKQACSRAGISYFSSHACYFSSLRFSSTTCFCLISSSSSSVRFLKASWQRACQPGIRSLSIYIPCQRMQCDLTRGLSPHSRSVRQQRLAQFDGNQSGLSFTLPLLIEKIIIRQFHLNYSKRGSKRSNSKQRSILEALNKTNFHQRCSILLRFQSRSCSKGLNDRERVIFPNCIF